MFDCAFEALTAHLKDISRSQRIEIDIEKKQEKDEKLTSCSLLFDIQDS